MSGKFGPGKGVVGDLSLCLPSDIWTLTVTRDLMLKSIIVNICMYTVQSMY